MKTLALTRTKPAAYGLPVHGRAGREEVALSAD